MFDQNFISHLFLVLQAHRRWRNVSTQNAVRTRSRVEEAGYPRRPSFRFHYFIKSRISPTFSDSSFSGRFLDYSDRSIGTFPALLSRE